jgi:hypothetical protein
MQGQTLLDSTDETWDDAPANPQPHRNNHRISHPLRIPQGPYKMCHGLSALRYVSAFSILTSTMTLPSFRDKTL